MLSSPLKEIPVIMKALELKNIREIVKFNIQSFYMG
jgi:hypothetical protein